MSDWEKRLGEANALYGDDSDPANGMKAFLMYEELAREGHDVAYIMLGICYLDGIGVMQDYAKAYDWLEKAGECDYFRAYYYLGIMLYDGLGVTVDKATAYRYFRIAEEEGDEESLDLLQRLPFTREEKKETEELFEPISAGEVHTHLQKAPDSTVSQYLLAEYYYGIGEYDEAERWANQAADRAWGKAETLRILIKTKQLMGGRLAEKPTSAEAVPVNEKPAQAADIPQTADGKTPNAVLVTAEGEVELVCVEDFSSYAGLGVPLDCERINIVSTQGMRNMSARFGVTLVGYVDAYGQVKGLENNDIMAEISGYDYLAGGCVICGFDKDYAPLSSADAANVAAWLRSR